MMQCPGIDPGNCLNYKTCGSAVQLSPSEELELIRIREEREREYTEQLRRTQERIRLTRHSAAILMLWRRGCPQSLESLGVTPSIETITTQLDTIRTLTTNFDGQYIAPPGCELHVYNVKRPSGTYSYYKLTAERAMFAPSEREQQVRVIHVSHEDDARYIEAQLGIERRNNLTQVRTLLNNAGALLEEATRILEQTATINSPTATLEVIDTEEILPID
ncbi:MAG: hypothetical protein C6Y22_30290 [Hapalosiphonaceae cyanobacterium JJU2]|nr:MAG: hypothetical protein C6Y22_30290 [Hapalosiphonaceae cyanobacterium JJU2]